MNEWKMLTVLPSSSSSAFRVYPKPTHSTAATTTKTNDNCDAPSPSTFSSSSWASAPTCPSSSSYSAPSSYSVSSILSSSSTYPCWPSTFSSLSLSSLSSSTHRRPLLSPTGNFALLNRLSMTVGISWTLWRRVARRYRRQQRIIAFLACLTGETVELYGTIFNLERWRSGMEMKTGRLFAELSGYRSKDQWKR